jgi:hypothetical protein
MSGKVDPAAGAAAATTGGLGNAEIGIAEIEDVPSIASPCRYDYESISAVSTSSAHHARTAAATTATESTIATRRSITSSCVGAAATRATREEQPFEVLGPSTTHASVGACSTAADGWNRLPKCRVTRDVAASAASVAATTASAARKEDALAAPC